MAQRAEGGRGAIAGGPIQLDRRHPLILPADDVLGQVCPELWATVDALTQDRGRPITGRIWLEIARRYSCILYLQGEGSGAALIHLPKLQRLHGELRELLSLVSPEPDRDALGNGLLEWLIRDVGQSGTDALRMVQQWARTRGRPAQRRPLAVRALEMRIGNPGLTWAEIGGRLKYPRAHQRPLNETLPAEVRHVKKILRRYGLWGNRRNSSQETPRKK